MCAVERLFHPQDEDDKPTVERTVPIAGEFSHSIGGAEDAHYTLIGTGRDDGEKPEGILLKLYGGQYKEKRPDGKYEEIKQRAEIEITCNEKKRAEARGEEDEDDDHSKYDDGGEEQPDGQDGTLKYVSYKNEDNVGVLRLDWKTKWVCGWQETDDDGEVKTSKHWGCFTWFIIM